MLFINLIFIYEQSLIPIWQIFFNWQEISASLLNVSLNDTCRKRILWFVSIYSYSSKRLVQSESAAHSLLHLQGSLENKWSIARLLREYLNKFSYYELLSGKECPVLVEVHLNAYKWPYLHQHQIAHSVYINGTSSSQSRPSYLINLRSIRLRRDSLPSTESVYKILFFIQLVQNSNRSRNCCKIN